MINFKKFIAEKKTPHALDPNKSLKHAITDRGFDKDNDGDVDKFDKTTPDEITGDEKPNQTPKMLKKYAGEKQHTKKGVAYEEAELEERSTTDLIKVAIGKTLNKKGYNAALEYMKKNKKSAADAAKVFSGVDARELSKLAMAESVEDLDEGSETWEAGYKRRVVKTTDPEHKEKGHNWRIKGKDKPNISIKLYKEKPSYKEFTKQMKRVAGHEFGG